MTRPSAGDIIIFILYGAITIATALHADKGGDMLEVTTESGSYAYSLDNDGLYSFEGPLGTTVIEIKDKRARIVSSPCPGQDCVSSGWSSLLCCLPNRILAECSNEAEGVDAVSG